MTPVGAEADEADLQALGGLEVQGARDDRVVEAEVLGRPDAVEAGLLGGRRHAGDGAGIGELAEDREEDGVVQLNRVT